MSAAEKVKNEGNEAFKSGFFARAEELYKKAERLDPANPFYPSNLSAALYEQAKYLEALKAIGRSRSKIADDDTKASLTPKLSTRLAKCLTFGVRNATISPQELGHHEDMIQEYKQASEFMEARDDCRRAWREYKRVEEDVERIKVGEKAARSRLGSVPVRKKCAYPYSEYYAVGHDEPMSILHDWGPKPDERQPLNLNIPKMSPEQLSRLSIFFAGIGDGRHALASIIGIEQIYQKLPKNRQKAFRIHLTLSDINATILARNLILYLLLDKLSSVQGDQKKEAELKMTLLCTWLGLFMPSYCYIRLKSTIMTLRVKLQAEPPNLPEWIYVTPSSIPDIIASLDHWLSDLSKRTTSRLLQVFDRQMQYHPSKNMFNDPTLPSPYQSILGDAARTYEANAKKYAQSLSDEEIIKQVDGMGFPPCPGKSKPQERREWLDMARDTLVELVVEMQKRSKGADMTSTPVIVAERYSFTEVPTFIPPSILRSQHKVLDKYWKATRPEYSRMDRVLQQQAYEELQRTFKPNLTLYCSIKDDPHTLIDSVENVEMMDKFNERMQLYNKQRKMDDDAPCYSVMSVFFDAVNSALATLQGKIKLEFLQGDYIAALIKMQDGDDEERPPEFPRKYTRMWLSNVPDYVGGPFAVSLFTLPSLETAKEASAAGNCMLNTGLWQPGGEQYMFTYSHLSRRDYERFLGGRIITMKPDFGVTEFAHGVEQFPLSLKKLPSRSETFTWLTRVLLGILSPSQTVRAMSRVHNPHTLTMFIRLLMHMHAMGYPPHWLSDFLHIVLNDELITDVVLYSGEPPTPLNWMGKRGTRRRVNLHPYRLDLETILALSYEAIPFPVPFPNDFARHYADIATFEAPTPLLGPSTMSHMYCYDQVFYLIFFKDGARSRLGYSIADILEGRRTSKGEVYVVGLIDSFGMDKDKIRWRMSKKRVGEMQQDNWKFIAFRHDINEYSLTTVSSAQWKEVQN